MCMYIYMHVYDIVLVESLLTPVPIIIWEMMIEYENSMNSF